MLCGSSFLSRLPFARGNAILAQDGVPIIFRQIKEIFACESDWLNFY
jgi:hypothetical protein